MLVSIGYQNKGTSVMTIALIGATGFIGSRLLAELVQRAATPSRPSFAIPRRCRRCPASLPSRAMSSTRTALATLLAGHEAVISAVHFTASDARGPACGGQAVRREALSRRRRCRQPRSRAGRKLFDTPEFPAIYLDEAKKGGAFLDLLKQEQALGLDLPVALGLDRSRASAPASSASVSTSFSSTPRARARSRRRIIAIALVDELEKPAHSRRRFTVGY